MASNPLGQSRSPAMEFSPVAEQCNMAPQAIVNGGYRSVEERGRSCFDVEPLNSEGAENDEQPHLEDMLIYDACQKGITEVDEFLEWIPQSCVAFFTETEVGKASLLNLTEERRFSIVPSAAQSQVKQKGRRRTISEKLMAAGRLNSNSSIGEEERTLSLSGGKRPSVGFALLNGFREGYSTEGQRREDAYANAMDKVKLFQVTLLLMLIFVCVLLIPMRIALGSDSLPVWLFWVEITAMDIILVGFVALNALLPMQVRGQMVFCVASIAKEYTKNELAFDVVALFPLQLLILPFTADSIAKDWCRVNRLLMMVRWAQLYDVATEYRFLNAIHPTIHRILKFVTITICVSFWVAAPMFAVLRHDPEAGNKWLVVDTSDTSEFTKVYLRALAVVSGRDFPFPATDNQIAVMLALSMVGVVTSSVIIAGVVSMVVSLVEQSSRVTTKIDDVRSALEHMNMPNDFVDEVRYYYLNMHANFQTFDYRMDGGMGILDELPPDLSEQIDICVNANTVSQLPLFAPVLDDEKCVRSIGKLLVMHLVMPGVSIVVEGEEGTDMFFISRGVAAVYKKNMGPSPIAFLGSGSFFGEQALLHNGVRGATVRTTTLCQVYSLSRLDIEKLITVFPQAVEEILRVSSQRLASPSTAQEDAESEESRAHSDRHISFLPATN